MPLNYREMLEHAALCNARCRCLEVLAVIVGGVLGVAAIAWLVHPPCWFFLACLLSLGGSAAAAVGAKLSRIDRRLAEMEAFL